jgi:hypothetical protein
MRKVMRSLLVRTQLVNLRISPKYRLRQTSIFCRDRSDSPGVSVWQGKGDFMSGEEKGGYFPFSACTLTTALLYRKPTQGWLAGYLSEPEYMSYLLGIVLSCLVYQ